MNVPLPTLISAPCSTASCEGAKYECSSTLSPTIRRPLFRTLRRPISFTYLPIDVALRRLHLAHRMPCIRRSVAAGDCLLTSRILLERSSFCLVTIGASRCMVFCSDRKYQAQLTYAPFVGAYIKCTGAPFPQCELKAPHTLQF